MTTAGAHPIVADEAVSIRPIHPADSLMEGKFIRDLSVETKHYRFLGGVKELSPAELKRLCDVDGRHAMAFVATVQEDGRETEIGVSRYTECSSGGVGEMAVTIADAWQHKGLGRILMERLIAYAKSHEMKQLYSVDLVDNTAMRELAADLGMSVRPDPDDTNQVVYSLTL